MIARLEMAWARRARGCCFARRSTSWQSPPSVVQQLPLGVHKGALARVSQDGQFPKSAHSRSEPGRVIGRCSLTFGKLVVTWLAWGTLKPALNPGLDGGDRGGHGCWTPRRGSA